MMGNHSNAQRNISVNETILNRQRSLTAGQNKYNPTKPSRFKSKEEAETYHNNLSKSVKSS